MPEISPLTWAVGIAALILGILAGHFGWGKRWPRFIKVDPQYLAGLDYLVTEQPDRALDTFLQLMDASADTLETHFALGALYRRRGEVERAIRIHQNLLARESLATEHREQALLALAHDYLRAGLLDRAEALLLQVSEVPRLRISALELLRGVYERQLEWRPALDMIRQLARLKAGPARAVFAHYLCELAALQIDAGEIEPAKRLLREARREASPFPRAALLRGRIAEREGDRAMAVRLLRTALQEAPALMQAELLHLLELEGLAARDTALRALLDFSAQRGVRDLKLVVFAALAVGLADALPVQIALETVLAAEPTLQAVWGAGGTSGDRRGSDRRGSDRRRIAGELGALLANADKYRCTECGFAASTFYWQCPACHAWDSFEAHAIVKLG